MFDLDLTVKKGEMVGYVGTNGSGKTTTIRHIMGFLKPTSGEAYVNGLSSWEHSSEIVKNIGYVPGEIAFPDLKTGTDFLKCQADFLGMNDIRSKSMFSKALFKQSCKANGTMWTIITFAVCFMLACVMLISGSGNIGEVKNSIQDTIITKEVDSQMQKRALSYYADSTDGLKKFDEYLAADATDTLSYLVWCSAIPDRADLDNDVAYATALSVWQSGMPEMKTSVGVSYAQSVTEWKNAMPKSEDYSSTQDYLAAINEWKGISSATQENAVKAAYIGACGELQTYVTEKANGLGYAEDSAEAQEMLGSVMYALNPNGMFDEFYTQNGETIPEEYDAASIILHISTGDVGEYVISDERASYREERAADCSSVFLAGNMSKTENVELLMNALSSYGVTKEKYDSFGYTYGSIKQMACTSIVTYCGRAEYELGVLKDKYFSGGFASEEEYLAAVLATEKELAADISSSFLSTLPSTVSSALEEIGKADLYTLVVGSIFYKLAGLLLPIIYMIMASNNLIAGQVDSGSMAYVLSTSTKRITVVFTQAVYLIGSLFAMFFLTTVTGCICLATITEDVALTYGNLILLNLGAFLVLLALSGLCFFTSCVFDRSKRSMAIGGGLSIFALVAAMLGLFGSPVIPSVVRLTALNNFNYVTIISLFDVISIMEGTGAFIWKFAVLAVLGVVGYIAGSAIFTKKDLPL